MKAEELPRQGGGHFPEMETGRRSAVDRLLVALASFGLRRPGLALGGAALLVAASVLSGLGMTFRSEVTDLVPAASSGVLRRLEEVFGTSENAFLLISTRPGSSEILVEMGRHLTESLRGQPDIRSVSYGWGEVADRLVSPSLLAMAPLFTRPEDIDELDRLLSPEGLAASVRAEALHLGFPGIGEAEKWVERDPLNLRRFIISRLGALKGAFRFQPGSLHMISEDGSALLVRIEGELRSSDMVRVRSLIEAVERAADEARAAMLGERPSMPKIELGFTGGYKFALESEASVKRDITVSVVGALVLVFGIFAFTMRSLFLLFPSFVPVGVGIVVGFGIFSIFRRDVIALSLVSGAILAGLGINFVVHLIVPAFSDPRGPTREAILDATRWTARPLVFESLTAAVAFLNFPLTGERFLSDLGNISAAGILCTVIASVTLLPPLLLPWVRRAERGSGKTGAPPRKPRTLGAPWLSMPGLAYPGPVLGLGLASGAASIIFLVSRPLPLEKDLRNVHSASSEAVAVQRRISSTFGGGGDPILIIVETEAEEAGAAASLPGTDAAARLEAAAVEAAARLEAPLTALLARGLVTAWSSPAHFIPSAEDQRRALAVLRTKDTRALSATFIEALEAEDFDPGQFEAPRRALEEALTLREPLTPSRLREAGFSGELDRMIGTGAGKGYALLAVYPRLELWASDEQDAIFRVLEEMLVEAGVRGELAGVHVISSRTARGIVRQFIGITLFACLSIVVLVFFLFRHPVPSLMALLPVALGTLWTGAICELLGIKLNFMNVGILPMVVGIGVDNGIHLVSRYTDSRRPSAAVVVRSTGGAILLTSLTTLGGFGLMAFSVNQGIASVGAISGIGIVACLLASLVVLPAALELSDRRRKSRAAGPAA